MLLLPLQSQPKLNQVVPNLPIPQPAPYLSPADLQPVFSYRLIGENTNPQFATTLNMSCNRAPRCFYLPGSNTSALSCFQPKFTETYRSTISSNSTVASFKLLTIF